MTDFTWGIIAGFLLLWLITLTIFCIVVLVKGWRHDKELRELGKQVDKLDEWLAGILEDLGADKGAGNGS